MKNIVGTGKYSVFVKRANGKVEQYYADRNGFVVTPTFATPCEALKEEARAMVEPGLLRHIEKLINTKEKK